MAQRVEQGVSRAEDQAPPRCRLHAGMVVNDVNRGKNPMRPTLFDAGLSFRGRGYFPGVIPRDEPRLADSPEAPLWFELQDCLDQLRRGDFSAVPTVMRCCRQSHDWRLKNAAMQM